MLATAMRPTDRMKTGYSNFRLAEIHEEAKVGDPEISICSRCLCFVSIFHLVLNDQGEFVCGNNCKEYQS